MTAPIQEPTAGRTFSGMGYGQRQLFRRPRSSTGQGENAFASIQWNQSSVSIANETWISMHDADPFSQDYFGGAIGGVVGDPPNFSLDLTQGIISWTPGADDPALMVIVTAWARWDDVVAPAFAAGDTIAVGIRTQPGSIDWINAVKYPTTPANFQAQAIAVTAPMPSLGAFEPSSAEAIVYQDSGSAKTCFDTEIFAQYVPVSEATQYYSGT